MSIESQGLALFHTKTIYDTLTSLSMVLVNHRMKVQTIQTAPAQQHDLPICIGGKFKLELFLPDDYPMTPPKIRFLTKIYHPNIDRLGRICLDVLKSEVKVLEDYSEC